MNGNLRDVPRRRPHRDPTGKTALFSSAPAVPGSADEHARGHEPAPATDERTDALFARVERRPGTLVVECSACDHKTRVGFVDFALLNLPFALWLPLPGLRFNRRMTCPACGQWAWMRAHWLD